MLIAASIYQNTYSPNEDDKIADANVNQIGTAKAKQKHNENVHVVSTEFV